LISTQKVDFYKYIFKFLSGNHSHLSKDFLMAIKDKKKIFKSGKLNYKKYIFAIIILLILYLIYTNHN